MDEFTYGLVNPLLAYIVACVGAALGFRCTVRALALPRERRRGWLFLGACSIGCGIWTMHFIAMLGFSVTDSTVLYRIPLTLASLVVAVVVVGIGVFYVGYRPQTWPTLLIGGALTGAGVAVMHYMGMAALELNGHVDYNLGTVALSVAVAIVAATVALWMTLNIQSLWATFAAAMIAGLAVCLMHYTAMQAVSVQIDTVLRSGAVPASHFILPLALGIIVFLTITAIVVAMSPDLPSNDGKEVRTAEPIQVTLFDGRTRGL